MENSRIIKFRAWDLDGDNWLEEDQFMIYPNGTVRAWIGEDDVKNVEIMQSTGLLDKNGKEIYEGDVLLFPPNYAGRVNKLVVEDLISFLETKGYNEGEMGEDYSRSEIIGNVSENPELLK